jgi:hypothetical protein
VETFSPLSKRQADCTAITVLGVLYAKIVDLYRYFLIRLVTAHHWLTIGSYDVNYR